MTQNVPATAGLAVDGLRLQYPMTVASYGTYAEAQKAVDTLADKGFPVEQTAIVGSDLRQYERVLGRRTWGTAILQGVLGGVNTGLFVALMLWLLTGSNVVNALLYGLLLGVIFGVIFSVLNYLITKGPRDFNSITQTYALRYDVMVEHKVAAQARQILGVDVVAPTASAAPVEPTTL